MKRFDLLLRPKLWRVDELWHDLRTPPAEPGVYAWYFDRLPGLVPRGEYHRRGKLQLLYVGISPARVGSRRNLRKRLREHCRGNARCSTLRKTLGCLLQESLDLDYRRNSKRFARDSEDQLSGWIAAHARVAWMTTPEPWIAEKELIEELSLPLNLQGNQTHPFHGRLTEMRKAMVAKASR